MIYIHQLTALLGQFAVETIYFLGYPGIVILMALESMIIPLPSEMVMPFAGFLAAQGSFSIFLVILASAIGSLIGSLISYAMGYYGGNKLVLYFGRWLLLDQSDLEMTEKWFARRGEVTIFIGRFIPVVRHLISIPAGIGKMDLKKFIIYTVIGAGAWNSILAYMGFWLGRNWEVVRKYTEPLSIIFLILIILAFIYFIYKHVGRKKDKS